MKRAIALVYALLSSGCTSVPTSGRAGDHWYFGLVRVTYPEKHGDLIAAKVRNLGLGFDGGLYLGWHGSDFVFARPEDCRIVIIVRDKADVAQAKSLVQGVEGACLVGKGS